MSTSPTPIQEIRTRSSLYSLRPDGLIIQVTLPNIAQTLDDAKENVAAFVRLAAGKKHPLLVDTRVIHSQAAGVREYYAGPEAMEYTLAIAVLIGSGAGRVIGNLFLAVSAPKTPTRLFTDETEAIAWLLKITRVLEASGR